MYTTENPKFPGMSPTRFNLMGDVWYMKIALSFHAEVRLVKLQGMMLIIFLCSDTLNSVK